MKSETMYLSTKYVYVRCDDEFRLKFTNGATMTLWRGFYCFKSEDLLKNQTNFECHVECDNDDAILWYLCTDTLIMSVTDMNDNVLAKVSELQGKLIDLSGILSRFMGSVDSNFIQLGLSNDSMQSLVGSIQNSFSIILNDYVKRYSITDFGFIWGKISLVAGSLQSSVYVARSDEFTFNCRLDYSFVHSVSGWKLIPWGADQFKLESGDIPLQVGNPIKFSSILPFSGHVFLTSGSPNSYNSDILVDIFDNSGTRISDSEISNISIVRHLYFPDRYVTLSMSGGKPYVTLGPLKASDRDITLSNPTVTYSGGIFSFSGVGSSPSNSLDMYGGSGVGTFDTYQEAVDFINTLDIHVVEKGSLIFDVTRTAE